MSADSNPLGFDAALRVRGVDGLRVVDASIMPTATWARGLAARLLLARGRPADAASAAQEVIAQARAAGVHDIRHASLLLAHAEALHAAGATDAARTALRETHDDLLARAAEIVDIDVRASFLGRVPAHARTLSLAQEWGVVPDPR